jgi:hypothetical protein
MNRKDRLVKRIHWMTSREIQVRVHAVLPSCFQ